ncbi:MAG: hypothetical protein IT342_08160, partial [Candidatus Melainabacteria bacterium]|nr:hypothetical protein [Candidatus Melainabacteria bacterium]
MANSECESSDLKRRLEALETELAVEKLKAKKFQTDIVTAQSQLKEMARRLEQAAISGHTTALGSKTQFIAKLTHELRTPLNGILGMCDLLLKTSLNGEQR